MIDDCHGLKNILVGKHKTGTICRYLQGPRSGLQSGLKFFKLCNGEKNFFGLSRGSGSMLPWKILKVKYLRLVKNAFPKIFQLIFLVSQNVSCKKTELFKNLHKKWGEGGMASQSSGPPSPQSMIYFACIWHTAHVSVSASESCGFPKPEASH